MNIMTAADLTGSLFPLVTTSAPGSKIFYRSDSIKPFSVSAAGKGFGSMVKVFSRTDSIKPFSVLAAGKKLFPGLNFDEDDIGKTIVTHNYEEGVFGIVFARRNDAVEFYESKIAFLQKVCELQPPIEAFYTCMKNCPVPEKELQDMARRISLLSHASLQLEAYKNHLLGAKATAAVIEDIAVMDVPSSEKLRLAVNLLSMVEAAKEKAI